MLHCHCAHSPSHGGCIRLPGSGARFKQKIKLVQPWFTKHYKVLIDSQRRWDTSVDCMICLVPPILVIILCEVFLFFKLLEGLFTSFRSSSTDRTLSNCWRAWLFDCLSEILTLTRTYLRMDCRLPGLLNNILLSYVIYSSLENCQLFMFMHL